MKDFPDRPQDYGGSTSGWMMTRQSIENIRRAFVEFLTIPSLVIAAFLLLAIVMYWLDSSGTGPQAEPGWTGLFSDAQATRDFLGVIASGIITMTTMTFSLLVIAVQQGAAALSSLVLDQFLRRKTNQFFFGFFVGLALFALAMLASVSTTHQPVLGVSVAGLMTVVSLAMLIFLIYSTINQMRPVVILKTIHDHTLIARHSQLKLLRQTRRAARLDGAPSVTVMAESSGFMTGIDVPAISVALARHGMTDTDAEVIVRVSIGDYVALGEPLADIRFVAGKDVSPLYVVVRDAIDVEEQRDIDSDPGFGIEQIVTIGWTAISTAKSNPDPGLLSISNLRDLTARWLLNDEAFASEAGPAGDGSAQIVYADNLPREVIKGFESLLVASAESMQHQCAAELYRSIAKLAHRMPPAFLQHMTDIAMRSLTALGDHPLTSDLDAALSDLVGALQAVGQSRPSKAFETAQRRMRQGVGHLRSRSTRL